MFPGGCYADKGCLPEMEENGEDKAEPRLKLRGLIFFYGMAKENMFCQTVTYSNYMFLKKQTRHENESEKRKAEPGEGKP